MAIHPSQILFYAGGRSLELFGPPSRRTTPIARRGEDIIETFSRASIGSYVDANGEVKLAEIDALRIDMLDLDVAGTFDTPALVLEGARTNAFTKSEELDDAAYTKTRATVSANAVAAPDGKTTADKLVEDGTASSTHEFKRNTPTLTDDTQQSFSVFAKAAERSEIRIELIQKDNTIANAWFDLSAGTVGTTTGGGVGLIRRYGEDWYRCTLVADSANGGTTPVIFVELGSGSETAVYNGDSSSGAYLWGMQFETDKPFPSSYRATAGSTVTRSKDAMTFPWVTAPRTMIGYARFVERGTVSAGPNGRICHIGDNTGGGDPRLTFVVSGSSTWQALIDDGTNIAQSTAAATPVYGDLLELRLIFDKEAGTVQLGQSINSGAEVVAAAGTGLDAALLSAWAGTLITMAADGAGANNGFVDLLDLMFAAGGGHTVSDFHKATQQ